MTDQTQADAVARSLESQGAHRGADLIAFNAAVIAEREAAQVGDLAKPAGRGVEAAEYLHPANDEHPVASPSSTA